MKLSRYLFAFVSVAALYAFAPSHAEAAEGTAKLSWVNPTTGCTLNDDGTLKGGVCDNVPLVDDDALTELRVYVDTKAITAATAATLTPAKLGPTLTTTNVSKTVRNGDTLYFRMTACNGPDTARVCSELSGQASKLIKLPKVKPGVPTQMGIAITVAKVTNAEFDEMRARADGVMTTGDDARAMLF